MNKMSTNANYEIDKPDDELLPGVEYDIIFPSPQITQRYRVRGIITSVKEVPEDLALSDIELNLLKDDFSKGTDSE